MIIVHTTDKQDWQPHNGACFLQEGEEKAAYGDAVYCFELADNLVIEEVEVTRDQIDANSWPGDRESDRAGFAARGVDVIVYDDMDENGRQHVTYRIVSDRAVKALVLA